MRNPLNSRIFRQLRSNAKIYLALFVMLTVVIGFISGLYVANGSMETAAANAFEEYNIEDGHFELENEIGTLREKMESNGITIYDQDYKELSEDIDSDGTEDAVIRIFAVRTEVNRVSMLDGRLPEAAGEIAIDRMHADNVGIKTGDIITAGGVPMTVTGLVAASDYSTLFRNNSDTMFDAITFDIGFVTRPQLDALDGVTVWQYAYSFNETPDKNEKEAAEDIAEKIAVLAATGGLVDNKDDAEELKDIADEADKLEKNGDELKQKAEDLEAKGDELQAEADALEAEGKELEAQGDDLKARGEALQAEKEELEAKGAELAQRGAELQAAASDPAAAMAGMAALQTESDELEAKGADLAKRAEALQAESDELQKKADELKEKGDLLKIKGDMLTASGDSLKMQGDILEGLGEVLEKRLEVIGITDTEALENITENKVTDFVPEYANQAIHFATDDFGSDKTMAEYLLVVFVIILAFIFGLTAKNAITRDAAVIGTLRASGYTKGELVFHYCAPSILVTVLSAVIGNILGYTVFKNVVVGMYYNSYSLPAYTTLYNPEALVKTSIIPMVLMSAITIIMTAYKLRLSPLKFMRRDLSSSKRKKAVRLPKWSFMNRFRMRIFIRSLGDYAVMTVGLIFVMVLMCFCLGMPSTLDGFIARSSEMAVANYQTILLSDKDEDDKEIIPANGEKFLTISLQTVSKIKDGEEITVYGYSPDSKYIGEGELEGTDVCVSSDYTDKFRLKTGDTIELKEKYSSYVYSFRVAKINDTQGSLGVYMPAETFKATFSEDDYFTGYFSDTPLEGVDEENIAKVITVDDISAMARQLNHSIGNYMRYFSVICLVIAAALLYLLTKQIIEKNAGSISMAKVLGYYSREISSIYVRTTTVFVMIMSVICLFIGQVVVYELWRLIMIRMTGWFVFSPEVSDLLLAVGGTIAVYLVISFADMRRIKRIPMTEALKNAE